MIAAEIAFWSCLLLVLHTYVLYPFVLLVAYTTTQVLRDLHYVFGGRERRRRHQRLEELPGVSIVVPILNEEGCLAAKIRNLRALDYPKHKIEVVFVSDGSTDGSNAILRDIDDETMSAVFLATRHGKPAAFDHGVRHSRHDIVISSDASTLFAEDTLLQLARHFSDPRVGVVCGALHFSGSAEHQHTEGVYWRYETALRLMEARMGATLTASGAIFAIRRQAYRPVNPDVLIEDFVIPMNARRLGYSVVFDPEARATDTPGESVRAEYRRRVRVAVGSFRALRELASVPMPAFTRFAFVSHKLLRWSLPFLLIGLLAGNLVLADTPLYLAVLMAQSAFYGLAGMGFALRNRRHGARIARLAYYLVAIHFAYLVGFALVVAGRREVRWS
jgi:cellulose synthase/poly-beta-1,6-N-acetylglucosamine synthase-like glycosyltransferase